MISRIGIGFDEGYVRKLRRVSTRVIQLLGKKFRDPVEAYLLLKILCLSLEKDFGIFLDVEEEKKLRRLFLDETEDSEV